MTRSRRVDSSSYYVEVSDLSIMKDKNSEIVLGTRRAPIRVEMCPPHGVYELNSTLFLLYCLFNGSFYNPLNLF
jgi:hypothetical protein